MRERTRQFLLREYMVWPFDYRIARPDCIRPLLIRALWQHMHPRRLYPTQAAFSDCAMIVDKFIGGVAR